MTYTVRTIRDLTYRSVDTHELKLDLHLPSDADATPPLVAYFHGGGFEVGGRSDYECTRAQALAARGIAIATVSYRLLAHASFPAPLDDARAAIRWLRANGATYGYRSEAIGAMGASAGGYLAAMLGLSVAGTPSEVTAAVPWFAPLDLAQMINGTPLERSIFGDAAEAQLLGGDYDPSNPAHRALNPIANVSAEAAAFLTLTGDRDRIVEHGISQRFHTALTLAGGTSALLQIGGAGHEDPAIEAPEVLDYIAGFFRSRLNA